MVMILLLGLTESEERKTTAIRVARIISQPWAVKEKQHQRKVRRLSHSEKKPPTEAARSRNLPELVFKTVRTS